MRKINGICKSETLELLGLQVDPMTGELRPMELLLRGLETR